MSAPEYSPEANKRKPARTESNVNAAAAESTIRITLDGILIHLNFERISKNKATMISTIGKCRIIGWNLPSIKRKTGVLSGM
jgi:hypothetical protein